MKYSGEATETEEMRPKWFDLDNIPYEEMWPDDKCWMPIFLRGEKFKGRIYFKDQNTILEKDIKVVSILE